MKVYKVQNKVYDTKTAAKIAARDVLIGQQLKGFVLVYEWHGENRGQRDGFGIASDPEALGGGFWEPVTMVEYKGHKIIFKYCKQQRLTYNKDDSVSSIKNPIFKIEFIVNEFWDCGKHKHKTKEAATKCINDAVRRLDLYHTTEISRRRLMIDVLRLSLNGASMKIISQKHNLSLTACSSLIYEAMEEVSLHELNKSKKENYEYKKDIWHVDIWGARRNSSLWLDKLIELEKQLEV